MINKKENKKVEDKIVSTPKQKTELIKAPVKPIDKKKDNQLTDKKISEPKESEQSKKPSDSEDDKLKEKPGEETKEPKKPIQKKPTVKKTEAIVNVINLPISTKHSIAICRFIKNKKIENAIAELEQVLSFKKAVPIKGEIPHRKGKGMMSGRYPKKATEYFIKLLKALSANANTNGLDNPVIVEAIANIASRPFGKFGRVRKKRTHVKIKVIEKSKISGATKSKTAPTRRNKQDFVGKENKLISKK